MVHVLDFLQDSLDDDLAPNTLRQQVAALSSVQTCGSRESLSHHPVVRQFLRVASNLRPLMVHQFPTWNLNKVLIALTQSPFEPLQEVSLRFLLYKVTFLVAFTSTRRISPCQPGRTYVSFMPTGLFYALTHLSSYGQHVVS